MPSPWRVLLVVVFVPLILVQVYFGLIGFVAFLGSVFADRVEEWSRQRPRDEIGVVQRCTGDFIAYLLTFALLIVPLLVAAALPWIVGSAIISWWAH